MKNGEESEVFGSNVMRQRSLGSAISALAYNNLHLSKGPRAYSGVLLLPSRGSVSFTESYTVAEHLSLTGIVAPQTQPRTHFPLSVLTMIRCFLASPAFICSQTSKYMRRYLRNRL
jgi:hypothetical protein